MNNVKLNILLLLSFVLLQTIAYAQPEAVLDTLEYDGGVVLPGESVAHNFVITNKGSEPLQLIDIHTTCGCTAAIPSATELVTGATSELAVKMNTGLSDATLTKYVILKTNDPKNQEIRLAIKAQVKNLITFAPHTMFDFGNVPNTGVQEKTLYLNSVDGEDVQVLSYKSNLQAITVDVGEKEDKGIPVTLHFDARKYSSGQRLASSVEIETNHPKQPIVQTRVMANVMGSIQFNPATIFFGVVEPGEQVSKEIMVSLTEFAGVNDFAIEDLVIENESLKGEILSKNIKGDYQLRFTFTAPDQLGLQNGKVLVQTNLSDRGDTTINYSGVVRAKR